MEVVSIFMFRRNCSSCNCETYHHAAMYNPYNNPVDRMCVEEDALSAIDEARDKGYAWVPHGLSDLEVEQYMMFLPSSKVPRLGSDGLTYRAQQLAFQLPLHDYSDNYTKFLPADQKGYFEDAVTSTINESLGRGVVNPSISRDRDCCECRNEIGNGSMAVFAESAGSSAAWHPQCFCCHKCKEVLVDLIYFFSGGNVYCGRHYAELDGHRCSGCDELIFVSEYSHAMDKDWHEDHFTCVNCEKPLKREKFVSVDGRPCCTQCYNKAVANVCDECGQAIGPGSKDIIVRDRHWHESCFVCSSCSKQLLNEGFTFQGDDLICHKCRGIDPAKNCAQCKQELLPGEKKVGYQNATYHESCFTCCRCDEPIGAEQFINKEDKRYCQPCFNKFVAKVCFQCNEVIKTTSVTYEGNSFHSECFVCAECGKPLAGKAFCRMEDQRVCHDCYLSNHAKTCAGCLKAIEGQERYIVYDNDHYHRQCFTCDSCKKPMAGEKFRLRNENERICMECA
ncbi:four and a half LIM domains protein 2-like isoform X2 [Dendronephthya gigantea]|uniref:four and a half LIM domains protein 2-like isoform X2 n=1 Tax=Dendronephthya gigantea TaxID=151771 RepID=UPI00106D4405|nr:four and a half LIM domains protein 2-like isoform X2 [Dendronephthya gigantea]